LRNIRLWHRIAKKHYIRLQYAATTRALRYFNAIKIQLYICIAIWSGNNVLCPNPRIFLLQPILHDASSQPIVAIYTSNLIQPTMQIQHVLLPSTLMQPINILCNQSENLATPL
jgi:hypothetical protein